MPDLPSDQTVPSADDPWFRRVLNATQPPPVPASLAAALETVLNPVPTDNLETAADALVDTTPDSGPVDPAAAEYRFAARLEVNRVWISLPLAAGTDRGRTVSLQMESVNPVPTVGNWERMIVTVSRSAREQYLDVYVTPTPGHAHSVAAVWVKFGNTPTRVLVGLCRNPHTGDDIGSVNLTALGAGGADAPVTAVDEAGATPLDRNALGPEDATEVERMAAANLEERGVFDHLLEVWRVGRDRPQPEADPV